jgi:hypothetical protein
MLHRKIFSLSHFFVVLFLFFSICGAYDIQKIDSLAQAHKDFEEATPQTLVVFDMDHTLMLPTEQAFNLLFLAISDFDPVDYAFIQDLAGKELGKARKSIHSQMNLVSAIFEKTNFVPVEQDTVSIIHNLQVRGVKVIALTSSNAGTFGSIARMEQWRLRNLHQIGLDFSTSFGAQEIEFPELPKEYGFPAKFYHGIICAALNPKGKVLSAFLNRINWRPTNILFFDDTKKQCESVACEMEKYGIPTHSYWYCGAYQKKFKLDQNLIQQQFDYWIKQDEFLSQQEIITHR